MKKILYNSVTLLLVIAIVYLSLTSRSVGVQLAHMDKVQHALAYAVLAFFMLLSVRSWGLEKGSIAVTFILCALIGGSLEIIQARYGRMMELGDFAADMAGTLLGCLAVRALSSIASKST